MHSGAHNKPLPDQGPGQDAKYRSSATPQHHPGQL